MKDKPSIFKNKITKKINNNKSIFYSKNNSDEVSIKDTRNVIQKINDIFASPSYVYKSNVKITTQEGTLNKKIIGRNKDYIITMDSKLIPIKDIIDIRSEKK